MINLTFVKYLLHAYKLLSIISFSPHKKFMKMDTFIISILYLRTLGKENYLIYTKSQNYKWWKQDWNPDLKDFTVHALQFHALKSLYHSACIFIIKSHLNTVIYPTIYFHTYFFAYFIIMSLPFLNLFNNLLLREVVQSFRLNSNYFKRHKKPYYVSNHPYHSAAHSSLQLNLMFPLYWKLAASWNRHGSFSLLNLPTCSSLCRATLPPPHSLNCVRNYFVLINL